MTTKKTTSRKVEQPPTDKPELIVEEPIPDDTNKYARKKPIAKPVYGRPTNYVETVGLGHLTVVTAEGLKNG